jgi:hypothetical protein
MTGVRVLEDAGLQLEPGQEHRAEHRLLVRLAELAVGRHQNAARIAFLERRPRRAPRQRAQHAPGARHEDRRRHALAGYIAETHPQGIGVAEQEVAKIAAQLLGRLEQEMHRNVAVVVLVVDRHHAELQLACGRELVSQLDHARARIIAQALFFERRADPRAQHGRVHRLGQVVFRAKLDAALDAFVLRGGLIP